MLNKYNTLAPNVVRGGTAIPLGNNFYYMKGRKHKNGGIDIGENPKTGLEVEGGEVMEMRPNEVRVYSSVPFLRGVSPAKLVLGGVNPNVVFNAQEEYKDENKLNDDGSKKAKYGENMIASINGNVKNGLIHTEMKCGGRRKAKYGSYDNMLGIGRANYSLKLDIDRNIRDVLNKAESIVNLDVSNIKTFNPDSLEKNLTNKEKENIVKNIISREKRYAKGNVEIVSPEFEALMIGRTIASGAIKETAKGVKNLTKTNKTSKKSSDIDIDLGDIIDKNVDKYVNKRIPKRRARKYNVKEKPTKTVEMPDITINQGNSGLFYGRKINNPNLRFTRRTMDAKTSRELDKIYDKVIGNRIPRSSFEFKNYPTEIPYTPITTSIGRTYDATAEWNKYFGKYLYNQLTKRYGKKGIDKIMKKEGISKYEYGGRKKADLGISYYAPSLFGPKYYKVVDLNPDGTRSERSLLYADATNPNVSYVDLLLNDELKGWSTVGNFSNRRIKYNPVITTDELPVEEQVISTTTPTSKTTTPTVGSNKTTTSTTKQKETLPFIDRKPTRLNIATTPNISKITLPVSLQNASRNYSTKLSLPLRGVRTEDWISLASNIGSTLAGSLIGANATIKALDLPEVVAPTLVTPGNLKTYYNINPQLSTIRLNALARMADIDRNTASSRTALARKQRTANQAVYDINDLYGKKENIETELYNRNIINKQNVATQNAQIYNKYLTDKLNRDVEQVKLKYAADAENIRNRAMAYNNLISGTNASIQDLISRLEQRRKDRNTLTAIAARSKDAAAFLRTLNLFE